MGQSYIKRETRDCLSRIFIMAVPSLKELTLKSVKMKRDKLILVFPVVIIGNDCCGDKAKLREVYGFTMNTFRRPTDYILVQELFRIFELARNILCFKMKLPSNFIGCPRLYVMENLPKIVAHEIEVFLKCVSTKEDQRKKRRGKTSKSVVAGCRSLAVLL